MINFSLDISRFVTDSRAVARDFYDLERRVLCLG
jgi:hypothetical protein